MKSFYAVYTGKQGEYNRHFRDGNHLVLKKDTATPITEEVSLILKDVKDVHIFNEIDKGIVSFTKKFIRETWHELVKKHGVKEAKEVYHKQEADYERIRQDGNTEAEKGEHANESRVGSVKA